MNKQSSYLQTLNILHCCAGILGAYCGLGVILYLTVILFTESIENIVILITFVSSFFGFFALFLRVAKEIDKEEAKAQAAKDKAHK